ncbi:DUF1826 domain-containing protein [Roseibium album]|uniref:DUF1826 domain-containing protein n=1 Tax=Roseibium album TaxID=311410 RepID=A0A0M6ZDU7_9HYPH|nr:DUF1826 domain-containing protein [Roseibium album]CTQ59654.1 hypothetical protein LA5094_02422 [Roseibium album]CTQ75889.1 hypothetical protein LA5095_03478 [Roseibium album]CTQ76472.1 hypothetical protein LA5096_04760 [Roseibium album]
MSIAEAHIATASDARDVLMGREPDIFADIELPGVAAVIWNRSCDVGFQRWIDGMPPQNLPELRTVVPFHLAEAAAIAACEQVGIPSGRERDMLTGDIGALALLVAKTLKTRQVGIRLDVSDEIMCPKFHVDNVPARLLCTYRGTGTQYVPEGWDADPERIGQVARGAVALFRGGAWPGAERTGLLHRSPAPDIGAGPRLLLVIDPIG